MNDVIYYLDKKNKVEKTDLIDELILKLYHNEARLLSDTDIQTLKLKKDYNMRLKKLISKSTLRVPMYDIRSNSIYLIFKENVYDRIFKDDYRFVDDNFLEDLKSEKNLDHNIRILENYDMKTLKKTYMKIFYESFILTNYVTDCQRPSSKAKMEHIKPYYGLDELFYLAHDWNLTNNPLSNDPNVVHELCKQLIQYDIKAETLNSHQLHIYDNKKIGLVKHYSLFGSYFINRYLRSESIRNPIIENQINLMNDLIRTAPPFIKDHTVYRFVETDDHLKDIKIGDTYTDPSFMSTTRNPFYYQENYTFGYILMKIKIRSDIRAGGLCIESYSNFPPEEEIVFAPGAKIILKKITDKFELDHQKISNKWLRKKYEFEFMGYDKIVPFDGEFPEIQTINFKEIIDEETLKYVSISHRLKFFINKFANVNNQFKVKIGKLDYVFVIESYDSTNVYEKFFYYKVDTGILIYSSNPTHGNINLMMEIGPEIHINYYFRWSLSDKSSQINLKSIEMIEFMALFAYLVGSKYVIIHSEFDLHLTKTDTIEHKINKTRYIYSQNVYDYLKKGTKYFEDVVEITPGFDYEGLDYLKKVKTSDVLRTSDRDELYRIYKESQKEYMDEFYIYVIESHPKFLRCLEDKFDRIYLTIPNPFKSIFYKLDAWGFLYNRGLINILPQSKDFEIKKGSFKSIVGDRKIRQFKNRLRDYLEKT